MVAIAQLVEHRIVIPVVAGSIPVGHPNFFLELLDKLNKYLKIKAKDSNTLSIQPVVTCHRKTHKTTGNHAFWSKFGLIFKIRKNFSKILRSR